jgi:quercetin dioxygenase-like cupin family protein
MRVLFQLAGLLGAIGRIGLFEATPANAQEGMQVSHDGERPPAAGPEDFFTGAVMVKPLFDRAEWNTSAAQVTFSPCARTAWHNHPGGQTLIVTSGTGWVQEWGGAKQPINPGDVIWTPPGVKHWHGAGSGAEMTHIAIQKAVDGRNVNWMEKVTDDQYTS